MHFVNEVHFANHVARNRSNRVHTSRRVDTDRDVFDLICSVIKVILQFCKENGLHASFKAIQARAMRYCKGERTGGMCVVTGGVSSFVEYCGERGELRG